MVKIVKKGFTRDYHLHNTAPLILMESHYLMHAKLLNRLNSYQFYAFFYPFLCTLLLAMAWIAMGVPKGEDVLWINGKHSLQADWFFSVFTYAGDGIVFVAIIVISLFVRFNDSVTLAAIAIFNGSVIAVLKRFLFNDFQRPIALIDNNLLHFVPGIEVHASFSFPSGHTATAFALAVFLSVIIRRRCLSIVFMLLALLVGYSRIYLLQHFAIDVAAGAIIGTSSALIVFHLVELFRKPGWLFKRITVKFPWSRSVQPTAS